MGAPSPPLGPHPLAGVIPWFVRNRVAANLLLFGISLGGLLAASGIPQEMIPETRSSALTIRTVFPGAGAEVVEDGVLLGLEEALRDVSGVKELASVATAGLGVVTVEVERWADFRSVSDAVRERIESLTRLPDDAEDPAISEVTPNRFLLRIAVHGDAGERTLTEAAHHVRDALAPIPGVARVEIVTGRDYEISIEAAEELLTRFGLTFDEVATAIRRVDGRRAVTVHASVDPAVASPGALLGDLRSRRLAELDERFPDLRFEIVGLAGDQAETLEALSRHPVFALILIYALLAVPLSSCTQPFVIMAAAPFGLAGAVFGHVVMGAELSMPSFFGMVPLVGIVVNDALVLLHFINRARRADVSTREAVPGAGPLRFRPIVLTSVTTCAGLAPLLAERSIQAQFLIPMAASLAFGVAFATLVTLLIVPARYSLGDDAVLVLRGGK